MSLDELHRIRRWHTSHLRDHPVECRTWDAMLALWVVGWLGWLPAFAFAAWWAAPILAVAMSAPTLYVQLRVKAHQARRLRCDWLAVVR